MERAAVNPLFRDKKNRVWEIDTLRGIAVIAMLFDHLMFDFAFNIDGTFSNFTQVKNPFIFFMVDGAYKYWNSDFRTIAHPVFVFIFLFLVGTSCAFSRDNGRRGAALSVVALCFTGITYVCRAMGLMEYGVVFGILDCIALCIILTASLDNLTKKYRLVNVLLPLVFGVVILSLAVQNEFWNDDLIPWDRAFKSEHLIQYILGARAYGDDWFGIFPWIGCVFLGFYWGKAVYSTRTSLMPKLDGKWNKPFCFVGRHALLFYIFHQVALTGIVMLLCLCLGYRM